LGISLEMAAFKSLEPSAAQKDEKGSGDG